jgi:hypothetical protein
MLRTQVKGRILSLGVMEQLIGILFQIPDALLYHSLLLL